MSTLYKIYTGLLTERLETEMEEKNIIPQNETGFRKGMEVIDNIYVLNYIVNRAGKKRGHGGSSIYRFKGGLCFGGQGGVIGGNAENRG